MMEYRVFLFFFFKQKTAYEMRISDWSSDVCSSDLQRQSRLVTADAHGRRAVATRLRLAATTTDRSDSTVLRRSGTAVCRRAIRQWRAPVQRSDRTRTVHAQHRAESQWQRRGTGCHYRRTGPQPHHRLDRKSTRLNSSH